MAFRERPPMRIEAPASPERAHPPLSRFIIEPPSNLEGYGMQLTAIDPNSLTPRELRTAWKKVDKFRLKQNGKGAWDNLKVNMTSARVVSIYDDAGQHQIIQYTAAPSTYFQLRAGIDKSISKETGRKLSHSGVMTIAITGGENPQIVLSTRPDNVNLYPRTITATASGSWEGQPQTPIIKLADGSTDYAHLPKLIPPTPQNALQQMQTELTEETGIPLPAIAASKTTLLGIAEDSQKFYWDTLWMVELPQDITRERLTTFHREAKASNPNPNDPMAGHLIFLDANPEKVREYLTQLKTFWDGNADRALLAVGKMLLMRNLVRAGVSAESANQQATVWMHDVNRQIKEQRQIRNQEVKTYRRQAIRTAWRDRRHAWGAIALQEFNPNREPVRQARQAARRAATIIDEFRSRPKRYNPHLEPEKQSTRGVKKALEEIGYQVD